MFRHVRDLLGSRLAPQTDWRPEGRLREGAACAYELQPPHGVWPRFGAYERRAEASMPVTRPSRSQ